MNKKLKIALYMHGGSANHGCEALVRTIMAILPKNSEVKLFSKNPEEDKKYISNDINVTLCGNLKASKLNALLIKIRIKLLKQKYAFVSSAYKSLLDYADKNTIAISIGGDNYCYDGLPEVMAILNKKLKKKGAKTVLLGCSIEPELIKKREIFEDLSRYDIITARESITYQALIDEKVKTNVYLIPDSAFTLKTDSVNFPPNEIDEFVGVNISPLILSSEYRSPLLFDAYCNLIDYVINKTDMKVALIPHVVWNDNDDVKPIDKIYELFKDSDKIVKITDNPATTIKGYISKCKFFVGARTHATIASYSSLVPTLVIGYSIKSKGIAKDIFGDFENFVVSSKNIKDGNEIVNAFISLQNNKEEVVKRIKDYVSTCEEKVKSLTELLENLR